MKNNKNKGLGLITTVFIVLSLLLLPKKIKINFLNQIYTKIYFKKEQTSYGANVPYFLNAKNTLKQIIKNKQINNEFLYYALQGIKLNRKKAA